MEKWKTPQAMSFYFASTNRNKRSITVDLKKDEGRRIIHDLIKQSDIMINNFIPGKMEQLGIGYSVAAKLNPSLIFASISGYGPSGPFATRAGYDLIAAAETGLLHITGEPDGPPTKPGVSMIDMCTGLYMHGAILAALEARHRTGKGQIVDASLFETQISMLVNVASTFLNTGQEGQRWGTGHPTIAPYSAFPTQDAYIVVGAVNDRQFVSLMTHLGDPDLCKDGRFHDNASRVQNRAALKAILDGLFRRKTTREWLAAFEGTGMPYAPINNIGGAFQHPQIEARGMIETMRSDATTSGEIRVAGIPIKFGETPPSIRRSAPLLGEHTDEVLQEIGMSDETITKLRNDGVL
ncbi:hypothetical protein CLAIMM_11268 isoform 1 [Cladophialophora immunda]|nr:hypothetical protein CLAIMM_11268 isoform 1 [Cladophialophora immunda]